MLTLLLSPETFSVHRLKRLDLVPFEKLKGCSIVGVSVYKDEVTLVVPSRLDINSELSSQNWRALKIEESNSLDLPGILNSVLTPIAEAKVGIFAMSTYDSDIVLFQQKDFETVLSVLTTKFTLRISS